MNKNTSETNNGAVAHDPPASQGVNKQFTIRHVEINEIIDRGGVRPRESVLPRGRNLSVGQDSSAEQIDRGGVRPRGTTAGRRSLCGSAFLRWTRLFCCAGFANRTRCEIN